MHRLKILNLLSFTRSNVEEFKRIQRAMPHVEISDGTYFKIVKDTNRIWEQSSTFFGFDCEKIHQFASSENFELFIILLERRSNVEEFKRIQRAMPHVEISDGTYFKIVKDTNRIWEIPSSRLDIF